MTNDGASALSVYPPSGGTVAGGSANAAYSLGAGSTAVFVASSLTNYYLESSGTSGSSGITSLTADVVTAAGWSGSTAAMLFGQTAVITATLASSTNNWSPSGFLTAGATVANVIRASVTASGVKLTGLAAPTAGGLEGAVVTLQTR